jgi:hypothetical protein
MQARIHSNLISLKLSTSVPPQDSWFICLHRTVKTLQRFEVQEAPKSLLGVLRTGIHQLSPAKNSRKKSSQVALTQICNNYWAM